MDVAIALLASKRQNVHSLCWNYLLDGLRDSIDESLNRKIFFLRKVGCHVFTVVTRRN